MQINTSLAKTQTLQLGFDQKVQIDLLRLDLIHPVISGNKWYKLRYYLEDAIDKGFTEIASFGGAYSNHIVATACASQERNIKSVGFIRGEQTNPLSHTLQAAISYGMQLEFINRTQYQNKQIIIEQNADQTRYWIPEGGYGILGAKGATSILDEVDLRKYTHIVAAVGSGTMIAGILNGTMSHQTVIGISSQKNNFSLDNEVLQLTAPENQYRLKMNHNYHFGGFAKHPSDLLDFMVEFWNKEMIPTDIVYTGKLLFAITDLLQKQYFKQGDKVLVIHSGGLQGNLSLPENSLPF
ncbi:MAG: pyridoxal-phosphate dependent enzyme [Bacteroidota bacterium]